ncbi:GTP cyclohydrolase II [Amylibacter kogurei]|uniref:GTP cyclohydrolase-2 n=1 Tax=Paramylibacter kogurei TaxID=1889778 RepID=A0A2G5K232_9RHOB|nr:GTP cyclohydrolase II [Amylibacter kogurei]PIB23082.1 GTP cyclohydrolase II [Amylibacter kogurei]
MALTLTNDEKIARLRADLRMGVGFVLRDGALRWLAASAETLQAERFAGMQALGDLELVITDRRARTLKTWATDGTVGRIAVPHDAGLKWVQSVADPADDLSNPLKGPFATATGGDSSAQRVVLELCKQARLLPAAVMIPLGKDAACELAEISVADIKAGLKTRSPLHLVSSARVPLAVSKDSQVHVFRPEDGGTEHYAIEVGKPSRSEPVLSRLHSACFTGDLIGSLKCDCGPQLNAALRQMGSEGAGVLLYLNQEGRGIGLANKMRAYSLQDQGFDTVDANHRLGFEDDERDFTLGSEILRSLGFSSARLMTNNPAKVEMMNATGIAVAERVPLKVGLTPENEKYLATKAKKSGHLF